MSTQCELGPAVDTPRADGEASGMMDALGGLEEVDEQAKRLRDAENQAANERWRHKKKKKQHAAAGAAPMVFGNYACKLATPGMARCFITVPSLIPNTRLP